MILSGIERRLIDGWQRDFPLELRPFETIARQAGTSEDAVVRALGELLQRGILTRVGVTVRPNTVGASTLAAMQVPKSRLETVAKLVSREPAVNHNYERAHAFNLWFVVTARDHASVQRVLTRISKMSDLEVLDLPLERSYYIDLGFPISPGSVVERTVPNPKPAAAAMDINDDERCLLRALEDGLALVSRPYLDLARRTGLSESRVVDLLAALVDNGVVTRFGLIVRHKELGFHANAMTVWDVEDDDVDRIGALFATEPNVTLCYRRPRRRPHWPYNLFCMIHGRERTRVLRRVASLERLAGKAVCSSDVLFSTRRFKQRGARLAAV